MAHCANGAGGRGLPARQRTASLAGHSRPRCAPACLTHPYPHAPHRTCVVHLQARLHGLRAGMHDPVLQIDRVRNGGRARCLLRQPRWRLFALQPVAGRLACSRRAGAGAARVSAPSLAPSALGQTRPRPGYLQHDFMFPMVGDCVARSRAPRPWRRRHVLCVTTSCPERAGGVAGEPSCRKERIRADAYWFVEARKRKKKSASWRGGRGKGGRKEIAC